MTVCKNCGDSFSGFIKDNSGKRFDVRNRDYCIKCNPIGERKFWRGKPTQKTIGVTRYAKLPYICKSCGKGFLGGSRNHECSTCRCKKSREERRKKAYLLLGNKCSICGYDKCMSALAMHHKNPQEKKFNLSNSWGLSWKVIEPEIKKCILLCCRCHAEVHDGITKIEIDKKETI
jgi:hypothetical protein